MKRENYYRIFKVNRLIDESTIIDVMKNINIKNHGTAFEWYQVKTTDRKIAINTGFYTWFIGDPCSNGNAKISKGTLCQHILPIVTCPNCGKCLQDCYVMKAMLQYDTALIHHMLYTYLAQHDPEKYIDIIINQINRMNKKKFQIAQFRIHESGDFFNDAYFHAMERLVNTFPEIQFFTYTKTHYRIQAKNFNLVDSWIIWKGKKRINFDDEEIIKQISKDLNIPICPCGRKNFKDSKEKVCCNTCKLCLKLPYVLFVKH